MPASSRPICFATSNEGKVQEARIVLSPFGITVRPFNGKGVEIQADTVSEVAAYSAGSASRKYQQALIVEDAGLFVESLDGFPGPFSSYVFKTLGDRGAADPARGSEIQAGRPSGARWPTATRRASLVSSRGEVAGRIARSPSGENGFGFDPVFLPRAAGGYGRADARGEVRGVAQGGGAEEVRCVVHRLVDAGQWF